MVSRRDFLIRGILAVAAFSASQLRARASNSITTSELLAKVRSMLADKLSVNPSKITLKSRLHEDLGADSLDTIEVAMAFEDEFDLDIPDEDVEKIGTVGDWIKYLMDKLKKRL